MLKVNRDRERFHGSGVKRYWFMSVSTEPTKHILVEGTVPFLYQ